MGQPRDRRAHTLAQFARRAGISEGRARALHAAKTSGLPQPDRVDADGRPLWWGSTIDAWCARTGRQVPEEALWIHRAPPAERPAAELRRGMVRLGPREHPFYVIVWDTDHGHVVYLHPLRDSGEHRDGLAVHAADLVEPRWWADAVVVMPMHEQLSLYTSGHDEPLAYVYRLVAAGGPADTDPDPEGPWDRPGGAVFGGIGRWLRRAVPEAVSDTLPGTGSARPKAVWNGQLDVAEIARVVGHPLPVWLHDTDTEANAKQTLTYNRTFTVPDTVTAWPRAQTLLEAALECGMPGQYPTAFAALAVDAADGLAKVRDAHERQPDRGEGWYLVCRPARPAPPIELERYLTAVRPVADTDLVGRELAELREVERDLDVDDPRGEVYAEAIELLEWQLRAAAKEKGLVKRSEDYVPVADDGYAVYSAPWGGPVVDAWRKTLTEVDKDQALRLRRVARLRRGYESSPLTAAYRDSEGRYVLVVELSSGTWSLAEWPTAPHRVAEWDERTILAGDDEFSTTTTLLALTSTDEGGMRVDPVPLPPRSHREAFAYGYGGGTPATTYQALLCCALDDADGVEAVLRAESWKGSLLWKAVSTTKGPLRLPWTDVVTWARADLARHDAAAENGAV